MPRREQSSSRRRSSDYDTEKHPRRSERQSRKRHGRSSARSSNPNSRPHSPSDVPPEMTRRISLDDAKRRPGYPVFSKAHSREALDDRDVKPPPRTSLPTPDASEEIRSRSRPRSGRRRSSFDAIYRSPPSPPLTVAGDDQLRRMAGISRSSRRSADTSHLDAGSNNSGSRSSRKTRASELKPVKASSGSDDAASRPDRSSRRPRHSGPGRRRAPPSTLSHSSEGGPSTVLPEHSRTSFASRDQRARAPYSTRVRPAEIIPASLQPGSPHVNQTAAEYATWQDHNNCYPQHVQDPANNQRSSDEHDSPLTPTPNSVDTDPCPRVDYLLKNGGLANKISTGFISSSSQSATLDAAELFAPIGRRLDEIKAVLARNGSLAVATGYRSVARRLLDRLEHIFNRDISCERCRCVICETSADKWLSYDENSGYSWGEILEIVSGRRDLPAWPPFSLQVSDTGPYPNEITSPMQKLDPDVPAQYRDHYLLQNDKTKQSVNKWLSAQHIEPSDPPGDVDDETLSFAMLTRLAPPQRALFAALMSHRVRPMDPTVTPTEQEETYHVLGKVVVALQRLYRLRTLPRDPECTMFLLNNQDLHDMLATLAEVSSSEWDILTSGRFDGFLWSGAEDQSTSRPGDPPSVQPGASGLRNGLRSPMPPSVLSLESRPTMAHGAVPAPVALDEETEIQTLCDMDRGIWEGMEALESHFEALHTAAEGLRRQLQSRAQGLVLASRNRTGANSTRPPGPICPPRAGPEGSLGEVGSAPGRLDESQDETASLLDDGESLAPDDSASNIGFSMRRQAGAHAFVPHGPPGATGPRTTGRTVRTDGRIYGRSAGIALQNGMQHTDVPPRHTHGQPLHSPHAGGVPTNGVPIPNPNPNPTLNPRYGPMGMLPGVPLPTSPYNPNVQRQGFVSEAIGPIGGSPLQSPNAGPYPPRMVLPSQQDVPSPGSGGGSGWRRYRS